MAIIVHYQGTTPLPTTIPVTINGVAYALNSSNGVTGVAAMLSANGVDQWGTWRTCAVVGDGTSGQIQVPWQTSDFAASGSYVLYIRIYYGVNDEILPPDVVQIPARTVNNAPPQSVPPTPPPDVTFRNLTITGTTTGVTSTPAAGSVVDASVATGAAIAPTKIAGTAVITSDGRLSDARTPTAHASTHRIGGSDALPAGTPGLAGLLRSVANNILDYGADPTGTLDSTTAIQNALNATNFGGWSSLSAPVVVVPAGTYLISTWLVAQPGTVILGLGHPLYNGARIKQADGTNIAGPGGTLAGLIVTPNWLANTITAADAPVVIENLRLDGNMANNPTSTACGIILMSFWSRITGCHVQNMPRHGIVLTDTTQNGTVLQNTPTLVTAGETRIERCKVEAIGASGQIGHGIYVQRTDPGGNQHVNDCFAHANLVSGCTGDNIRVESAGGWLIQGNHCYSASRNGIYTAMGFGTRIIDNYVEAFGGENLSTANGGFYDGIAALNIQGSQAFPGYGVEIRGNHVGCYEPTAQTSLFSYIHVGAGAGQTWADAIVRDNHIGARVLATSFGYGIHVQSNASGVLKVYDGGNSIHNVYQRVRVDTPNDIIVQSSEGGEQRGKPTTVTANYTALGADATILVDAVGKTVTLPAPQSDHFPYQNGLGIAPPGRRYTIANTANGAGTTIVTAGGTIGGVSSYALSSANSGITVETDGVNWVVLGAGAAPDADASAARIETVARTLVGGNSGISNGFANFAYFTPTENLTVANLLSACRGTAAAGATLAKLGLYTVDASNNLTCVARSANVASSGANVAASGGATNIGLWTSANHLYTTPIADNGAASPGALSTYTLQTGQRYALALLIVGATTLPQLAAANMGVGDIAFQAPILATVSAGGQADLAASYTAGSVSGNGALFYGALT